VIVEVKMSDGGATISVADDGPGIPVDEYLHVFKRFYRLERSRRTPGNGLGLSLVAAVARLDECDIEMFDNAPSSKVSRDLCRDWRRSASRWSSSARASSTVLAPPSKSPFLVVSATRFNTSSTNAS
jgi:hypothetical protein